MKLNLQFISHPGSKERLVVIPESEFRMLERAVSIKVPSQKTPMSEIPESLLDKIAEGRNPIQTIRVWRGLNSRQLANLTGISASMISQIERTGKTGSTKTFKKIAEVLGVPLDLIFPNRP